MPSSSDMSQFLPGQILQSPPLRTKDLTGKTIIVIGAISGLGLECAKHLANQGISTPILAVRNPKAGETAKRTILEHCKPDTHPTVEVCALDMSSPTRVHTLPRLDRLIANAGVDLRDFSLSEGLEPTLMVNVVGTFVLGVLVLLKLRETSERFGRANLTFVGSMIHIFAKQGDLVVKQRERVLERLSEEGMGMEGRYFLSKLLVHLCARAMVERVGAVKEGDKRKGEGEREGCVVVNTVNPGWCKTALLRHDDGGLGGRTGLRMIGRTVEEGSRTLVHAVTAGKETHGTCLSECRVKSLGSWARSEEGKRAGERVWKEVVERIEQLSLGATVGLD